MLLTHISSSREKLSFQLEPCHTMPVTAQCFGNPRARPPARARLGDDGTERKGSAGSRQPAGGALCGRAWALHLPVLFQGGTGWGRNYQHGGTCVAECAQSQAQSLVRCFQDREIF